MKSNHLIYYLDPAPEICAYSYVDHHVRTQIKVYADILATVVQSKGFLYTKRQNPFSNLKAASYKFSTHPAYVWAMANPANFFWLLDLAHELHEQMFLRFSTGHNCYDDVLRAGEIARKLTLDFWYGQQFELSAPPIDNIPKECRVMLPPEDQTYTEAMHQIGYDELKSHRLFYIEQVARLYLKWSNVPPPAWLKEVKGY